MSQFDLDTFIGAVRQAATGPDPRAAIVALMAETLADPDAVARGMPEFPEDETVLFEDDSVSIWAERFRPDVELPPHDHAMTAILGVYRGREENRIWTPVGGRIRAGGRLILGAGEMHVFAPEDIHSVTALDGVPSFGIHVYLGPLTRIDRTLFDWETGASMPLTGVDFDRLVRAT